MIKLIKSTFYNEKSTKTKLNAFIKKADYLSFGNESQKFEDQFAQWQGRKQCVLLNSGSSANLAVIQALLNLGKLKKGDKVGFSAVTWSTNVMPLIQLGLTPVPVDVELGTLNISPDKLETVLKKQKLKMLFLTNLLGFVDDITGVRNLCRKHNVLLIEDNCESLGTVYKGIKTGNFGIAGTFSFYVGHHMSTIEGGAVCTDDEEFATMLRLVRAHGWDRNLSFAKQEEIRRKFKVNSTFYSRYTFYDLGYNLRPTEITGFLGQVQLTFLDEIIRKREENFRSMAASIYAKTDKYYPVKYSHIEVMSNFAVPIICRTEKIRDDLVKRCDGVVEIRPVVGGDMQMQPFFRKYVREKISDCPNARLIHDNGLYFGNNPDMTGREIRTIKKVFSA
jgi:CDP-4-dehydro-6-deoxyglucose reductase, E1